MSKFKKGKHMEEKEIKVQEQTPPETVEEIEVSEAPKEDKEKEDLVAKAEAKANEFKDMAQRIQAEFENYRKRTNDAVKTAKNDGENGVIIAILPLLDTVGIALNMVADDKTKEGLNLIVKQFNTLLTKYGVEEIKAEGEAFNPDFHNAVMQVEDVENAGKVVEVLQKGYIRDGKVIRYAMVKVAG